MDSKITLDFSNPEIAEALKDCEVGVPETITIVVTPTSIVPGDKWEADVTEVQYSDSEEAEPKDTAPEAPAAKEPEAGKEKPVAHGISLIFGGK